MLPEEGIPSRIEIVSGENQVGTVGSALAESLVVRVLDAQNRPVPGQAVTFTPAAGSGTVSPTRPVTAADGTAQVLWTLGGGSGTQQVEARAVGGAAPEDLLVIFHANAGAATPATLARISGDNQSATAGSTLPDSLIVRATDSGGNGVAGVTVVWSVSGGGTVSDAQTVTGTDGRTGVRRTLGPVAGTQITTATAAGLAGSPLTFTATATVGTAGRLVIVQMPSATAASGQAFATQPHVQVQDALGNNVPGAGRAVTAELASGAGALIGSTTASTNADGLAMFSSLGITGGVGTYTLNFTGPSLSGTTSGAIQIASGSATRLALVTAPPGSASSGVAFGTNPRIQLQDASGNPVAQSAIAIGVSIASGSAALGGATSVATDAQGIATFSGLSLTGSAGSQVTLLFASSGLTSISSGTITLGAGQVSTGNSTLAVGGSPITASSGGSTATVTVTARDASGNIVAGAAVVVGVSGTGNTISAAGTTNASGVYAATVSSTQAATKTVTATINGSTISQQGTLLVNAAGPNASLSTVDAAPGSLTAGSGTSTITVTVRDAFGNSVAGASVALSANGTGNNISQPGATNASGVTTGSFSSTVVGSKTISAVVNGSVGVAQTATVVVGSGSVSASNSTVSLSPASFAAGTGSATVTVTARDASGNVLAGAAVGLAATGSSALTPPSGNTNSSGVFTSVLTSNVTGDKQVTATINGVAITESPTVSVTAGAPSVGQSTVSASPATISAGGTGSTITVTVKDALGNPVPGRTVTLAVSPAPGSSVTQPVGVTNGAGVATGTVTATAVGSKTVTATIGGIGAITQTASVTVNPGTASAAQSSVALTGSPIVASSGSSTANVTVTVRDAAGNPIPGVNVSLSATGSGNTFTPQNGLSNASGVFTATVSSTQAGAKTVAANAGGVEITQTQALTVNAAAPSTSQSLVSASPTTIEATSGTSTITITVRDAFGNPVAGRAVTLAALPAPGTGFTQPAALTSASGATTGVFSSNTQGSKTITATITGVGDVAQTATVDVVAQSVSAGNSTVVISPSSIAASSGSSASTITITARDGAGNPIPGVTVNVFVSGSNTISQPSGPTNASGVATATVHSTEPGVKTVSAIAGGVSITQTPQLTVTPGPVSAAQSTVDAESPRASGSSSIVTVTVKDQFGNPIPGAAVVLSAAPTTGTVTQPAGTTNASGVTTGTFSSTVADSYVISATAAGTPLTDNATIVVGP